MTWFALCVLHICKPSKALCCSNRLSVGHDSLPSGVASKSAAFTPHGHQLLAASRPNLIWPINVGHLWTQHEHETWYFVQVDHSLTLLVSHEEMRLLVFSLFRQGLLHACMHGMTQDIYTANRVLYSRQWSPECILCFAGKGPIDNLFDHIASPGQVNFATNGISLPFIRR